MTVHTLVRGIVRRADGSRFYCNFMLEGNVEPAEAAAEFRDQLDEDHVAEQIEVLVFPEGYEDLFDEDEE